MGDPMQLRVQLTLKLRMKLNGAAEAPLWTNYESHSALCVLLRPPPIDSELVWIGDFWSKTVHCESGERLWLQGEAAFEMHSFKDAEPQRAILLNDRKNHEISPKQLDLT